MNIRKVGVSTVAVLGIVTAGMFVGVDKPVKVEKLTVPTQVKAQEIDKMDTNNTVLHNVPREDAPRLGINALIAEAHFDLNTYKEYDGNDPQYWSVESETLSAVADDISLELRYVDDKALKADLVRFTKLVTVIRDKHDRQALLQAHSLIHELDVKYNNYSYK
ncbi:hypothetical protein [Priestia megaterium]|uniref:hypothetical protein n=1 Tax=Priestia megaterium TaxID=1404 RepID=UPI000BFDE9A3|nr:hypothetical protein [Priestia megaterium]PGR08527.1 hypothetical protein COA23_09095 [Priestia megaterium]